MFKNLKIENVQSHAKTTLEFSKGVNAIVGSSNAGKSAILRSIIWAVYNRPMGDAILLSHFACDEKGKQKKEMSVTIETDKGTVKRLRSKTKNQYVCNWVEYEALKGNIPNQVQGFFNFSDINLQKQMDPPFLLSMSGMEASKFFNALAHTDIIDVVLSKARQNYLQKNSELKIVNEEIATYDGLEEKIKIAKNLYKKSKLLAQLIQEEKELGDNCAKIAELGARYNKSGNIIQVDAKKIAALEKKIKKQADVTEQTEKIVRLSKRIKSLQTVKEISKKSLNSLKTYVKNYNETDVLYKNILDKIRRLHEIEKQCIIYQKSMEDLKAKLPKICPLCGGKLYERQHCKK